MKRMTLALILASVWTSLPVRAEKQPPNIVLIMTDDMGLEWLSCYGGESIQTPALDRMAEEGLRFTDAFSTPLCTPSRVQIMTGKYNYRNYAGFGNYPPGEPSFANHLRDAGYTTFVAGKWQLEVDPAEAGFDQHLLWRRYRGSPEMVGSRYWNPHLYLNNERLPTRPDDFGPDVFTDHICRFIEENKDGPFLVYYPKVLPHQPFDPSPLETGGVPPEEDELYQRRHFPGLVKHIDHVVGRILDTVRAQGIAENTLVIFTSDNGTPRAIHARYQGSEYRGGKGIHTDAGTRVPCIAWWPGQIRAGDVSDELVDFTDVLTTLMDVAGLDPTSVQTDGHSLLPVLRNAEATRRTWVMTYMVEARPEFESAYWVRDHHWKLYHDGRLYHVSEDPDEEHPVRPDADTDATRAIRERFLGVFQEMDVTDDLLNEYLKQQKRARAAAEK